ncbi:DUF4276 family protein [Nannocystis pusilla]|uniref:DUF4276 family protein n=1 Tax=Nannocystis pusilla TaxID=889268 RepID=UPI0023EF280F|nr:DUF4276 family protein [Nannocystis pusilla]
MVDSEGPVRSEAEPWGHVARRRGDQWQQPAGIEQDQLHFMVEAMEAWILADPDALAKFYGNAFERRLCRSESL